MATQIYLGNPPEHIRQWIIDNYVKPEVDMTKVPLHFIAEEPNATMSFMIGDGTYDTSTTGEEGSWTPYESNTPITLANIGDKVYFRAGSDEENDTCRESKFIIENGKIAAKGNIQSLLDRKLERMTVSYGCYHQMFYGCTALTQAPELPATTLAQFCYNGMFQDCTSLTKAPLLPATTLAESCYSSMFQGCTSLTKAPELPATTLFEWCYSQMFQGCTSLTKAPELPATRLDVGSYKQMFSRCTSLTQASFPNLGKEYVVYGVVENQEAFTDAASNIEATCKDGILIINETT